MRDFTKSETPPSFTLHQVKDLTKLQISLTYRIHRDMKFAIVCSCISFETLFANNIELKHQHIFQLIRKHGEKYVQCAVNLMLLYKGLSTKTEV